MSDSPEVVYEDADLAGVVKPSGMLSEGDRDSLETWAQARWDERARCCHRLDKPTSGVILIRKNRRLNREVAELFANHRVRKCYWALTQGIWPKTTSSIELPIAPQGDGKLQQVAPSGKPAKTSVRILGQIAAVPASWLELILKTGRTHQARVHCAAMHCPILGDAGYGALPRTDLFGLHARELRFIHPLTREHISIKSDPPSAWNALLEGVRQLKN